MKYLIDIQEELMDAILYIQTAQEELKEQLDAIGDMVVVLTNLAELLGLSIEECVESAYDVISKRTGKMKNGTFVKD